MDEQQNAYLSVTATQNATDSLSTALAALGRDDDMKWKWIGFALHHALYSFAVAALHHANWETVTSSGRDDVNVHTMRGNGPWYKCRKVSVPNVKHAYRLAWEPIQGDPPGHGNSTVDRDEPEKRMRRFSKAKLIGFWTALARVQDGHHWMNQFVHSKPLSLTDEEIKDIAWLTENVRNRLIHFVPHMRLIEIEGVRITCLVALRAIEFLVSESGTILFRDLEARQASQSIIEELRVGLENIAPTT